MQTMKQIRKNKPLVHLHRMKSLATTRIFTSNRHQIGHRSHRGLQRDKNGIQSCPQERVLPGEGVLLLFAVFGLPPPPFPCSSSNRGFNWTTMTTTTTTLHRTLYSNNSVKAPLGSHSLLPRHKDFFISSKVSCPSVCGWRDYHRSAVPPDPTPCRNRFLH